MVSTAHGPKHDRKQTHFAQNVCRGHLAAAEGHGAGGRRSDAELVLLRANGDASELCFFGTNRLGIRGFR